MAEDTPAVDMTPVTPTEAGAPPKVSPFGAAPAPAAKPAAAPATPTTIRLKPVIRKPMIRKPMIRKPAAPTTAAAPAPKTSTGNLKSVTGPIPAQAVLKKTGIVAEGILTPAQAQAAKSKTSRISLESAIGVAPAKEAPAPLKTIRLRRPADLKPGGGSALSPAGAAKVNKPIELKPATPTPTAITAPAEKAEEKPADEKPAELEPVEPADAVNTEATTVVMAPDSGVTQKKTLKLRRPGVSIKKPTLGVKRPGAATTPAAAPETPADGASADGEVKELSPAEMGDVPELKPLTAADMAAVPEKSTVAGVPSWLMTMSIITSIAALAVIGFVAFMLVQEGCGPDAGENAMAFIVSE